MAKSIAQAVRVLTLTFALLTCALAPGGTLASGHAQIPESYTPAAENETFGLYVDHATLAFKLVDKRSGYVWHSGIDELQDGDRLNRSWHAFAQSGLSIEYYDARAVNRRVSLANTEHTLEVTAIDGGIEAQVVFTEYGIAVGLRLLLEEDGVRVDVPFESIREDDPGFRLGRLYLYPFLGATRGASVPGYIMLPDGTGSIVRFTETTKARNMFYGRYYGADLGITEYTPWDWRINLPMPMALPVYGIAHEEQHAFVSIVEQGASYGELQVHPAGIITNFNFAYTAYVYNDTYFQRTNRSGAGVTVIQRRTNAFDVVAHYRFLSGGEANYTGMARGFRGYLEQRGMLRDAGTSAQEIGIRLEFLGGDREQVLAWRRFVPMTTIAQMREILAGLRLPNAEVIYYGWQPLGATSVPPRTLALEGSLGSVGELRALADEIAADGGHFSLYLEPQAALWGEPGYSERSDVAMAITNVAIESYNRSYNLLFSHDALRERFAALSADVAGQLGAGLALDGIGWMLYSDYREDPARGREAAAAAYRDLLGQSPARLTFYRPNAYFLGLADAYYDMPLGDNGYVYTSEAVPFLPIVLSGAIPYYGSALNFSSNRQDDLLRHAEYGISPSYFLTHEPTATMLNTPSAWIYSSSYEQWGEPIRETYAWLNALLGPVAGQAIVGHDALADGVYATTYESGRRIVVNYTDRQYEADGVLVDALGAVLVEAAP